MFHMLSCFNLKPGEAFEEFRAAYHVFVEEMQALDLALSTGPLGRRQNDTPMDTDEERDHQYFSIMTFRDRAQVDAAYAHIEELQDPAKSRHMAMFTKTADAVFICWEDIEP